MEKSLESLYGLEKHEVELKRVKTKSGKWLEVFPNPGSIMVGIDFPEFTCKCPRTSQPDFASINIKYLPKDWCVELKSLKYYYNAHRDEGHFHEEVIWLIAQDLVDVLEPLAFHIVGEFNVRGGTSPTVEAHYEENRGWVTQLQE
jgi:7-cyano-7-deazaguanine reductase